MKKGRQDRKLEHSSLRSQLIGVMGYWNNAGMGRRPSDKKREAGKPGEQLFT